MLSPRNALYVFVATCALAVAACQPAEGPGERAGKGIDNTSGGQADKAAAQAGEAVDDAKK